MKLDKISLIYPYITDVNNFELVVYTDASYAKLSDGYSSTGDIFFFFKYQKLYFIFHLQKINVLSKVQWL